MPTDDLPARVATLETTTSRHAAHLAKLDADISEIRTTLVQTATKADVAAVDAHIDRAINGVLRDALNSVPAKHMVWLTTVLAVAAIIGTFLSVHVIH